MKSDRFLILLIVLLLASVSAFAQGTTGALTGTVTTEGNALPGATVSVTSPSLQGTRTAVTDVNGNYNFAGLPPGDYTVRVELSGMAPTTRTTRVMLAGTARADADLRLSSVTEAITVTASAPAVLETTEVEANYQKKLVDELPLGRTVTAIANLSPGVTLNGPRGGIQVSGGFSSDNLILVNGANIQENLRGQPQTLYVEDAIQETTVMTGAVSAEFGRFTGGVVSSITKSGGNEFSGSLRDSVTNPSWSARSAAGEPRAKSTMNNAYEATFGGRIIRDRLWFFTSGRHTEATTLNVNFPTLTGSTEQIFSVTENTRYELKLTGQVTPKHSLVVNYLDNPLESTNNVQIGAWETAGIDPSISQAEDFKAAHYSGIFSNNFLAEANWSTRTFVFVGFGGDDTNVYTGTPLIVFPNLNVSQRGTANAPYFCGSCDNEHRDNELLTVKGTYFLGTKSLGTHNIVGGFEDFMETRQANNYQSPTNLTVWLYNPQAAVRNSDGSVRYTLSAGDTVEYYPVEIPSIGSDLTTRSVFLNDKWDLNKHLSFNVGARWDHTDAMDEAGNPTADEQSISPRLGAIYDLTGNGRVRFNASYGKYVGRLAEGVQGSGSNAGSPAGYYYFYDGDDVSGSSAQIVRHMVDWFNARGGTNKSANPPDLTVIGGFSSRLAGSLKAPDMDEWTVGIGTQLGPNGYVRADYINRDWDNYYVAITNRETGLVRQPTTGDEADLTLIDNTDLLDRKYKAVQAQAQYRFFNRLNVGGNYTWSELTGNAEGENVGSGPIATGGWIFQYPEYQGYDQNTPYGFLAGDQTHKLRAWVSADFALGPVGRLNLSVLERLDSGTPYSAVGQISPRANPAAGNPADFHYHSVPVTTTYYFSDRGAFRFEDITRTDLAVNYSLPISRLELFFQGEVFNAFNEQAQVASGNLLVHTGRSSNTSVCPQSQRALVGAEPRPRCEIFNPFTQTPVEGRHYALDPGFGSARSSADYQLPRTYQFSVGLRF